MNKKVSITLKDLHKAWNFGKKSSENYIGNRANKSMMVVRMAYSLNLIDKNELKKSRLVINKI